jgi:hypothetical protein
MNEHVVRGYFGLHDNDHEVKVHSSADFLMYIWARNVETFAGGVQVLTPPSQFRGAGSSGPLDGLVMDVPAQTGTSLGCLGGKGGETFSLSSPNARITIYVTVVTAPGATVTMTRS